MIVWALHEHPEWHSRHFRTASFGCVLVKLRVVLRSVRPVKFMPAGAMPTVGLTALQMLSKTGIHGHSPKSVDGEIETFAGICGILKNSSEIELECGGKFGGFLRAEASSNGSTVTPHCSTITSPTFGFPMCFSPCLLWCILTFFFFLCFATLCAVCDCGQLVPQRSNPSLLLYTLASRRRGYCCCQMLVCVPIRQRSALQHSVRSGAFVFVARNISLLVAKACVTQKSCSSPRRTSIQSRTFHCLRQTLPFRGTLVRHDGNILTVGGKCFLCAEVLSIPGSTGLVIRQQWVSSPCHFLVLCHCGVCRRDSSHFQGTDHTCSTGTVISMFVCTVNAFYSRRTSSSNTCC